MRSLAPVLVRPSPRSHPTRSALAGRLGGGGAAAVRPANDMRLFLEAWLGGLVFFGTLLA